MSKGENQSGLAKRILIVEDDPILLEGVTMLLEMRGFVALTAGSAADAVSRARAERPDLILMDITIPDTEGAEAHVAGGLNATREIKTDPATAHIPVIAVSARAFPHELKAMSEAGCDAFAEKPYEFDVLLDVIEKRLAE